MEDGEHVVFFSFVKDDEEAVLKIKGNALNNFYEGLAFGVKHLLQRWDTTDPEVIRKAVSKTIKGATCTVVLVGNNTHKSSWVPEEVKVTLDQNKPVYAMRLKDTEGEIPACLSENNIDLHHWCEKDLQSLVTQEDDSDDLQVE